jgi:hypothetical protein
MDEKKYNTDYAYVVPESGGRTCSCARCRCRGLMGPAVLITLGVLFLLSEFDVARFHSTWPILLIVIGLVKVLGGNADTTGHVDVNAPPAVPPPRPPSPGSETRATQSSEPRQVDHV